LKTKPPTSLPRCIVSRSPCNFGNFSGITVWRVCMFLSTRCWLTLTGYSCCLFRFNLSLLTCRMWWAPSNATIRQMGFNWVFKGQSYCYVILIARYVPFCVFCVLFVCECVLYCCIVCTVCVFCVLYCCHRDIGALFGYLNSWFSVLFPPF
jgi:hypothetical protein